MLLLRKRLHGSWSNGNLWKELHLSSLLQHWLRIVSLFYSYPARLHRLDSHLLPPDFGTVCATLNKTLAILLTCTSWRFSFLCAGLADLWAGFSFRPSTRSVVQAVSHSQFEYSLSYTGSKVHRRRDQRDSLLTECDSPCLFLCLLARARASSIRKRDWNSTGVLFVSCNMICVLFDRTVTNN